MLLLSINKLRFSKIYHIGLLCLRISLQTKVAGGYLLAYCESTNILIMLPHCYICIGDLIQNSPDFDCNILKWHDSQLHAEPSLIRH